MQPRASGGIEDGTVKRPKTMNTIQRIRAAGLLWPTFATSVTLAILIGLGTWQWQRMHWKRGLLDRLEATAAAAPVTLGEAIATTAEAREGFPKGLQYRRVEVRGMFYHEGEFHVWAPERRGPSWQVVTPLALAAPVQNPAGDPEYFTHVMVVRGIVPDARKAGDRRAGGQPAGTVRLTGRVRLDAPNVSAPDPDTRKNQWYTRDLDRMTARLAETREFSKGYATFAPFFLEAANRIGPEGAPEPRFAELTLSNRHFEYALTWWGLALTLIGVYAAFVITKLRGEA